MVTGNKRSGAMTCRGKTFLWGERTYVMGAVNVTLDSFSGDGVGYDVRAAVDLALSMEAYGADIIDVGGESTRRYNDRPGAEAIDADEELRRVVPVLEQLVQKLAVPISIDTYKAEVADRCLDLGVSMINDIWGVRADLAMLQVAARHDVPIVLMHNKIGHAYSDMVPEIINDLQGAVGKAREAGVRQENILVDPGIGFGKVAEQCLELEGRISDFRGLEYPVLVGPSRKSHIGLVLGGLPPDERVEGTAVAVALCIAGGADMVRVHDVKEMVRVVRMSDAIVRGWRPAGWSP